MVLACCLLNTMNTYHVGQDSDYVSTAFVCMYVCMIHCDTPVYSSYCLGQPSLFYGHYFLIVCPSCTNPIQNDLLNAATCLQWLKILVPQASTVPTALICCSTSAKVHQLPVRLPCVFYISKHLWCKYFVYLQECWNHQVDMVQSVELIEVCIRLN